MNAVAIMPGPAPDDSTPEPVNEILVPAEPTRITTNEPGAPDRSASPTALQQNANTRSIECKTFGQIRD
jgi:hypothetical protein